MKVQTPLRPLIGLPMPAYMTSVAVGTGFGALVVLILIGVLTV